MIHRVPACQYIYHLQLGLATRPVWVGCVVYSDNRNASLYMLILDKEKQVELLDVEIILSF